MDSMPFNYNMEDQRPKFLSGETDLANDKDNFVPSDAMGINESENAFAPMTSQYGSRTGNDFYSTLAQQEPRTGDTAPTANDINLLNYRMNNTSIFDEDSTPNLFANANRTESVASAAWTDSSGGCQTKDGEMIDTFDFLVKSLSSANNYVSMLTREQFTVLRCIRPSLLYEFLQEIARIRSEKRMRRALPNECAFCKNNGEIEECFTSHALKDWRGRVLCPVLRAFRCPRCGATGDRAHTIKYCPEAGNGGLSSANNYVSMLTREQFTVLRCIRPSLLYEFLQEIARIRSEKRMRRALPNECAFCKNNGEIEECFTSHALKDWRGRVLCPVLRAFRCPRCGATGDRAHTIKYCPEAGNGDRVGLAARRRGGQQSSLLIGPSQGFQSGISSPPTITPGPLTSPAIPSPGMNQSSIWNTFGLN